MQKKLCNPSQQCKEQVTVAEPLWNMAQRNGGQYSILPLIHHLVKSTTVDLRSSRSVPEVIGVVQVVRVFRAVEVAGRRVSAVSGGMLAAAGTCRRLPAVRHAGVSGTSQACLQKPTFRVRVHGLGFFLET